MIPIFKNGDYPPLRRWTEPAQIAWFTIFAIILYFMSGLVLTTLGLPSHTLQRIASIRKIDIPANIFVNICYPFVTTILAIWLPMVLIRWSKKPANIQMLFAGVVFALLHIKQGPAEVIQKFMVGWLLAACFTFCNKENWTKAYRITSITHASFNTFLLFFYLIIRWLT